MAKLFTQSSKKRESMQLFLRLATSRATLNSEGLKVGLAASFKNWFQKTASLSVLF